MKELIIDIVKTYYTDLISAFLIFTMGTGLGLMIGEKVWNEEEIYQGDTSKKAKTDQDGEKGTDREVSPGNGHQVRGRRKG